MAKLTIHLNDEEQEKLERVSELMARDPRKQAYLILINTLNELLTNCGAHDERK